MTSSISSFFGQQSNFERVERAIDSNQVEIEKNLKKNELALTNFQLLIVVFKESNELFLFAKANNELQYREIRTYEICGQSGVLGPKRKEGDGQVPEGFYHIDRFNPKSKFHLSLGITYPNESDRKKGDATHPGSDIFIHGSCQSTGCIAITDAKMEEVYLYALHARNNGQNEIPVYIFPFNMTDVEMERYRQRNLNNPDLIAFWKNLKMGYDLFFTERQVLEISFSGNGDYIFLQ